MNCITLLNYSSVLCAFIAAICWFISAYVRVAYKEEVDESGWSSASITVNGADLIKTIWAQSKWSAIAAIFAGLAALIQALALYLG